MAVDESANKLAILKALSQLVPKIIATNISKKIEIPTCAEPKPNTICRIATSLGIENSKPNVKSRKTIPNSATK